MSRLSKWWNADRVGRVEEGTSQDMCPTNGDAVILALIQGVPLGFCLLYLVLTQ